MPVLTTAKADRERLLAALLQPDNRLVVCLCAAWCDTCEQFKTTFAHLAEADPSAAYLWVDIEDDSELLGDLDIENFPTLAVYRGQQPIFFGVTPPQESVVARTVAALAEPGGRALEVPDPVALLPGQLQARVA